MSSSHPPPLTPPHPPPQVEAADLAKSIGKLATDDKIAKYEDDGVARAREIVADMVLAMHAAACFEGVKELPAAVKAIIDAQAAKEAAAAEAKERKTKQEAAAAAVVGCGKVGEELATHCEEVLFKAEGMAKPTAAMVMHAVSRG